MDAKEFISLRISAKRRRKFKKINYAFLYFSDIYELLWIYALVKILPRTKRSNYSISGSSAVGSIKINIVFIDNLTKKEKIKKQNLRNRKLKNKIQKKVSIVKYHLSDRGSSIIKTRCTQKKKKKIRVQKNGVSTRSRCKLNGQITFGHERSFFFFFILPSVERTHVALDKKGINLIKIFHCTNVNNKFLVLCNR